ncbi:Baseplate J family protein [Burkholderia multivorans]|uniref:Baseplate J family protein n=1 Tax=Burkholderia multivorans TaxID=87883 RepID=UPI0012DAC4FC|nr:Baseplate J family protein [Burkholderia multivorans]
MMPSHPTRLSCRSLPAVAPTSRNGRPTARVDTKRSRVGTFCCRDRTRSAENGGISSASARKSLIPEASTAPSRSDFAQSRADFAPNSIFTSAAATPFSSFSNLLKKKKKEYEERQEIAPSLLPRVLPVLPSFVMAAYFLCPESAPHAPHICGQMRAGNIHKNQLVMAAFHAIPQSPGCAACGSFL